jgi:branched-chain amino acid transport system substrate-binding protein
VKAAGGELLERIAVPPTETRLTRCFPRIPRATEVLCRVMVGPAVLTFVKEPGAFCGSGARPEIFGFIDRLEAVGTEAPGLEFLEGTHFREGHCRDRQADATADGDFYRAAVGVTADGTSVSDARDVATHAPMRSCREMLFVIEAAMEASGHLGSGDRQRFVEAIEAMTAMPAGREHPQGDRVFNGQTPLVFGHQFISRVEGAKPVRVPPTPIGDTMYPDAVDHTAMAFRGGRPRGASPPSPALPFRAGRGLPPEYLGNDEAGRGVPGCGEVGWNSGRFSFWR